MSSPEINQKPDYQREAGTFLSNMDEVASHLALDYSVESLQRLDQFITEHFEPPSDKPVSETLPVGVGCYLGEVIIRNLGGFWNKDGKPEINGLGPLDAAYPLEKAMKRFKDGRSDSLAWYYHGLAKQTYDESTGTTAQQQSEADKGTGGLLSRLIGLFQGK